MMEVKNSIMKYRIKDITEIVTKGTSPSTYGYSFGDSGVNFFKVESLLKTNRIKEENISKISFECHDKLARSKIEENDILFSIAGTLGRVCVIQKSYLPANTNQALAIIRLKKELNVSYVYWALQSYEIRKVINSIATTGAQPNLSLKQIGNLEIFLPQLKEQKKIAEILSVVDEKIEQTNQLIEKSNDLKRGLMQELLSKGVGHTSYTQSEVGLIPSEWTYDYIDNFAERKSGHTPDKKNASYWQGTIPWISLADLAKLDKRYIFETDTYTTSDGVNNSSAIILPKGTIVISRDATVGKIGIMGSEMATSQHYINYVCGENLNNIYLYYYLLSKKELFKRIAIGSTIKTIGLDFFKKLKIVVPPIDEQHKIANILTSVDEDVEGYEQEKVKFEELKEGLMQQLLTGKIRVKVD